MRPKSYCHRLEWSQWLKIGAFAAIVSLPPLGMSAGEMEGGHAAKVEQQQGRRVTGMVTDSQGEPLIGASVRQKGTSNGSITDMDGKFTLILKDGNQELEISYVGYRSVTVRVKDDKPLSIQLDDDSELMDEVVVVGYGKSSVKRLTSSVATVKGDELLNLPNTNVISSLEGRAPGVFIQSAGGEPGALPTISIRGGGEPLYVIDGIPSNKSEFAVLSPDDIESFSILKDAAAAAVYGARAGNGIVMVTTKKGNSDKIRVNYSGSYSLSSPTQSIDFLPNTLVAELQDRAAVYNNGVPTFMKQDANGNLYWPDGVLEQLQNGTFNDVTGNTDWNSLLFHKYAPMQSHSVSLNGGSENTHYFMSARYYHLGGIYKTDISSNDRLNMRMHLDHYFDKIGLRVNGDVSFSQDKTKYPPHGLFTIWTHVARLNSLTRCFNNQGHPTNGQENPYVEIDPAAGYRKGDAQYTNLSLSLDWAVPKVQGLNLGALVHYNLYNDFNKDWYANETGVGPVWDWTDQPYNLGKAHLSEGVYRSNEVTYEFRADYNRTFKEDHTIGATVVFNSWKYNYNEMGASRREYDTNVIEQINGGPSSTAQNFGTARENGRLGLVGRLKYDYKMRYLFEANFRYDGSDKFPKGSRWGFFPSVSVGWNIDEEPFMQTLKESKWFSALKFRFSWGIIGLDDVANFAYLSVYPKGHDFYQNGQYTSTLYEGGLVSPDLTWYSRNTLNYALDAAFFENRLAASFEYFYYRTTNYLANPKDTYTTPLGTALPMVKTDSAHRRAGYELSLSWKDRVGSDFHYNVGLNLSYYNKYGYIRKASLVIDKLTNNPDIDEAACRQFIAEARCLRVLVYDWMVRRWGGVMLVDKLMTPADEMQLPRASEEEMYRFMVDELKLAIPDLPSTGTKERFTKGAALTLLTRVALEGGLYEEAIAAGEELFEGDESANWSIDPDYRSMFGSFSYPEQSPEIQLYLTQGDRRDYCDYMLPMYVAGTLAPGRNIMGPDITVQVDCWCANWPSHELTEAYLAIDVDGDGTAKPYTETAHWKNAPVKTAALMYSHRDKRFDATICYDGTTYFGNQIEMDTKGNCYWENTQSHGFMTQSGYMWRKYIYEMDGTDALPGYQKLYDFRYILLRLGEACLNYAEALGRMGRIADAVRVMNMTRTQHGGLPALSENVSEEEFWKNYKTERRVELVLEGDRYFSVIRWAKVENATSVPEFNQPTHVIIIDGDDDTFTLSDQPHGSSTGSDRVFSWPKRMYFPIPESETMSNPNLSQNNYW